MMPLGEHGVTHCQSREHSPISPVYPFVLAFTLAKNYRGPGRCHLCPPWPCGLYVLREPIYRESTTDTVCQGPRQSRPETKKARNCATW